jgi:hypothetical protein
MSIRQVTFSEADCSDARQFEVFNSSKIFKLLPMEIEFGVLHGTKLPIIVKGPLELPESGPFCCFYGAPWRKDVSRALLIFQSIECRVFSLFDSPARDDEFDPVQILAMETAGHSVRCAAMKETDLDERFRLFSKAYRIYEGALLSLCGSTLRSIVTTLRKDSKQVTIFQPMVDMPSYSFISRRITSHSFAGMAICALMGQWSAIKYASLASAAVVWEPRFPAHMAATLRMLPLLMSLEELEVPGAGIIDRGGYVDKIFSTGLIFGIHTAITDKVLLPALLTINRLDLFNLELGFIMDEAKRAKTEQFARAVHARCIVRLSSPAALTSVHTHVVDGQIIERTCLACGVWDRTGKSHLRCSGCMLVYYCNKECQLAHWKEHKKVCADKKRRK